MATVVYDENTAYLAQDEDGTLRVYCDPLNYAADTAFWMEHEPHVLFNTELPPSEPEYQAIVARWITGTPLLPVPPQEEINEEEETL
jgi:hypothetical protein